MNAEEGKGWVGDGVDEMVDEVLAGGLEEVVFAAEGDDAGVAPLAGEGGDAVAVEAGAIDEEVGVVFPVEDPTWFDFGDGGVREDLGTGGGEECDHGVADVLVVDDTFFGDAEGEEASGMGFYFADLFGWEEAEAAEAVLLAAVVEVVETREFGGVGGDDKFAADFVADRVFLAEGEHLPDAVNGEAGFVGAGLVVEAGVEDSGIVAGLVAADGGLLFEDGDLGVGEAVLESEGGGEADDAAANDGDAGGGHWLRVARFVGGVACCVRRWKSYCFEGVPRGGAAEAGCGSGRGGGGDGASGMGEG